MGGIEWQLDAEARNMLAERLRHDDRRDDRRYKRQRWAVWERGAKYESGQRTKSVA